MSLRLILGGTFDPIHKGHLQMAEGLMNEIKPDEFCFVPNYQPPHRQAPVASPEQRLKLLRAALQGFGHFCLDEIEFKRKGISYSVDTLQALRGNLDSRSQIAWILGLDAFLSIPTWHQPESLADLCHIVLVDRKGFNNNREQILAVTEQFFGKNRLTDSIEEMRNQSSGVVYASTVTPPEISATEIREKIKQGTPVNHLVPQACLEIIVSEGLYLA